VLAAGIAYGRAAISGGGVVNRYVTLMAPTLCGCYLAWARFGPPPAAGAVAGGTFLAAVALAWPNARAGLAAARGRHLVHTCIERDVYRGVPVSILAEQHRWFFGCPDPSWLVPNLQELGRHGVAPFHRLADEPRLRDVPAEWKVDG
jgi:hypothetical protein